MGFFDALFGSKKRTNVEVVPDLIWMTTDAKFAGLAKAVAERSKSAIKIASSGFPLTTTSPNRNQTLLCELLHQASIIGVPESPTP
jgi:hypothetical protein